MIPTKNMRQLLTATIGAAMLTTASCGYATSQSDDPSFLSKTIHVGKSPNSIEIADFNHDGSPDLAIANTEISELTLLLGNGKGQFAQAPHSPYKVLARPHTHGIAVADYNSDGRLDMATRPSTP
jgi:hypothetical protein